MRIAILPHHSDEKNGDFLWNLSTTNNSGHTGFWIGLQNRAECADPFSKLAGRPVLESEGFQLALCLYPCQNGSTARQ